MEIKSITEPSELKEVKGAEFGGERALFATSNLRLVDTVFHPGESALKCCRQIDAELCRFEG